MNFDGSYRRIGSIDPGPLVDAVAALGEGAWSEYTRRQQTYVIHTHTQTIPLLYDEDMRHRNPTPWPRLAELRPVIQPVLDQIAAANPPAGEDSPPGYFNRIILTRLSPSTYIDFHRDSGRSFLRSHRNHVAITTNPGVEFEIEGERRHLEPGEIWEINNRRYHAVRNAGDEPRIHLIIDYAVPGEKVYDPERGWIIA